MTVNRLLIAFAGAVALLIALTVLGVIPHDLGMGGGLAMAMATQTAYNERIAKGANGALVNTIPADLDTRICETVAGIGFGVAVGRGAADKGAILAGAANTFVGISVRDVTLQHPTPDLYYRYDLMGVMTKGDIWVVVDGNVADGQDVTYDTTTGKLGTIAADATHILVSGARWMTSASSGELAVLRLTGALGVS